MYQRALAASASPLGQPPAAGRSIGSPPSHIPQPHVVPPPYSVARDPGWHGIIDPSDAELVNFLDRIEPEERQMLQQRVLQMKGGAAGAGAPPPAAPPMPGAAPNPMA
jgi:hypothetical protein